MSIIGLIPGIPGVKPGWATTHKIVFKALHDRRLLPQGKLIDGTQADDWANAPDYDVLTPGTLLGRLTSNGKYAASVLGTLQSGAAGAATSITLSAAQAAVLARRVGNAGTVNLVGPPAAAGVVASNPVTYSAVNLGNGVVTCTALAAAAVAGSFLMPNDGSQTILTFVHDGWGIKVSDMNGVREDEPFPLLPIGGTLISAALNGWPTDVSLQAYVMAALNKNGDFVFDHIF